MKSRLIIITALFIAGAALLILLTADQRRTGKPVVVGLQAPEFEVLDTANGSKLLSSEIKGSVVFVNFWASWCKPCKEEMPSIEALYKEMSRNDNFRMITIIYKESTETSLAYMKANGYTFPVYSDPQGNATKNYGVTGLPETYLVDKKGVLRKRIIGPADWNSAEKKDFIYSLLNE